MLKVISHHGARLATPIRSVQRVLDETESRSSPFRDMRNASQTQRRPYLLLDSQVASSDDDEDDSEDDIQDTISRLSEQLAKTTKAAAPAKDSDGSGSESDESSKDPSDLNAPSHVKKPKEVAPVADGNSGAAGSIEAPATLQQTADPASSDDPTLLQETGNADSDVRENLMDRIYAGTEETLVKSHTDTGVLQQNQAENGKATLQHPLAAAHVPATEHTVEMPEEKVPHLYSNNVGLDDVSDQAPETASPDGETSVPSIKVDVNFHSGLTDHGVKTAASVTNTEDHQVHISQKVNDKHVDVHVAVGSTTLSSSIDDPWKQPSPLEREGNDADGEAAMMPTVANDPWKQASTIQDSDETGPRSSSSDDLWTQKAAQPPSRPTVDPNLIPGVAIDGPKHTLPLDEDVIILDDSPTLVALGKPNSGNERRESSGASSDARDRER